MSSGVEAIAEERWRQRAVEGWTPEHDDGHQHGELVQAARCYLAHGTGARAQLKSVPAIWPWAGKWWKPRDRRRDLVRAGALIAAEIDRLDRQAEAARRKP